MRRHRYFTGTIHDKYGPLELRKHVWMNDKHIVSQWRNVMRYREGDEVILFDGTSEDRLYKIHKVEENSYGLELVTELTRHVPAVSAYLFFSLLKKDKNEWVIQKATELGVSHIIPLLTERTQKTGFDIDRAQKIAIEAAEQCGRSDIPRIRNPLTLHTALQEYKDTIVVYWAEQSHADVALKEGPKGICIGPEGGWSESEKALLEELAVKINIAPFTLRAETAAIVGVSLLTNNRS